MTEILYRVIELNWVYKKLEQFLNDAEEGKYLGVVQRIDPILIQLRISIDSLKKDWEKIADLEERVKELEEIKSKYVANLERDIERLNNELRELEARGADN